MSGLLPGAALLLLCAWAGALSQGRWSNGWAAAALPGLLVLTAAQLPAWQAPLVVGALFSLTTVVAWARVLPAPTSTLVVNAVASGVVVGVALAASRPVADLAPLAAPAVVALVIAGSEVLGSRGNPFGEWGSLAHTQARRPWALAVARRGPHVVTACLVLVSSAFGFAATQGSIILLVLASAAVVGLAVVGRTAGRSRRAAGTRAVGVLEEDERFFTTTVDRFVTAPSVTDAWWSAFRGTSSDQHERLLRRTCEAGTEGADLVVWCEGAGLVAAADHRSALEATAAVARSTSTWVVASWLVLDRESMTMDNVCTVLDPAGDLALTCAKRFPVPGVEADRTSAPPPGDVAAVDTSFGRLAVLVCFDADHAASWRQVARCGADVVAVPASDWPAIASLHADMAVLRARSAEVAVVRPARGGLSVVATARGEVAARQDHRRHHAPPLQGLL